MTGSQPSRPEGNWFWRRLFVFAVVAVALALVWILCARMPDDHLRGVAYALIVLVGVLATYYLIAPSATEIVRFMAAARPGWRLPGDEKEPGA